MYVCWVRSKGGDSAATHAILGNTDIVWNQHRNQYWQTAQNAHLSLNKLKSKLVQAILQGNEWGRFCIGYKSF